MLRDEAMSQMGSEPSVAAGILTVRCYEEQPLNTVSQIGGFADKPA